MSAFSVALDVSAVPASPVGAGRYTIALAAALGELAAGDDEGPELGLALLCRRDDGARFAELAPKAVVRPAAPASLPGRLVWGELGLDRSLRRLERSGGRAFDVLHAPHYTMPARLHLPVVVTVHDLTLYDHPEWHERSKVAFFRRALSIAARRASLVVCPSAATARRFEEVYSPRAPVVAIPHGIDHRRFRPDEPEPGADEAALGRLKVAPPYVLHLGTLEPRKDVPGLVEAFERVARQLPELGLVLAGPLGWGTGPIEAALAASKVSARIRRLGYVPEEDLAALLRRAAVVVYPAFEEGFGLPALEALACGAPLVTTEASVMAETTGGAALLVPPAAPDRLAAAVADALSGGPAVAERRRAGLVVAARYRWEETARQHLAAYRRAAEQRPVGQ